MKKYRKGILISFFVTVNLIAIYFFNHYAKHFFWLEKEIPTYKIMEKQDSVDKVVKSKLGVKGGAILTMSDGQNIGVAVSRNGLYEKKFIADFVQVGDSIHKVPGSDTIFIYRNKVEYYFILGKIINED